MMGKIVKFKNIEIESAVNGASIEFTVVKESNNTFDDMDHRRMEMVFEDNGDILGLDKALSKMREIFLFNKATDGDKDFSIPSIDGAKMKS